MRPGVILEAARRDQLLLDHVVEAELPDGDEHGAAGGPVGAVEQLAEALLAGHAHQTVDGVLVAENRKKAGLFEEKLEKVRENARQTKGADGSKTFGAKIGHLLVTQELI